MLTTLMLSLGVPMLLGGDEVGRTQRGNNNGYCQDSAISWFDWSAPDGDLLGFTRKLVRLRKAHPVFRRRRFLTGVEADELSWYTPAGTRMTPDNWRDPNARSIALYLDGADDPDTADDGTPLIDDDFLLLVNAWWEPLEFVVPSTRADQAWEPVVDTYEPSAVVATKRYAAGDGITVRPRSIVVLQGTSRIAG
jgi:glycogen operon protein